MKKRDRYSYWVVMTALASFICFVVAGFYIHKAIGLLVAGIGLALWSYGWNEVLRETKKDE